MSGGSRRPDARTSARARRAIEARRRARRRAWLLAASGSAVVLAVVAGLLLSQSGSPALPLDSLSALGRLASLGTLGPIGPEGVPVPTAPSLAPTDPSIAGQEIDGIQCQASEQPLFHIHAHLAVFVDGKPRRIPYGIGIPSAQTQSTASGAFVDAGSCYYWLHTHAADGIIHVESPVQRTYTLGDFFDIWGEPLGPGQVGPAKGPVTALFDGSVYRGNPRTMPLEPHALIQLEVGRPLVAPERVDFSTAGL